MNSNFNTDIKSAFMHEFNRTDKFTLPDNEKDIILQVSSNIIDSLSEIKFYKIKVEILPGNSMIFNMFLENDCEMVLTKYYYDEEVCDEDPFITLFVNNNAIFHGSVPVQDFVDALKKIYN